MLRKFIGAAGAAPGGVGVGVGVWRSGREREYAGSEKKRQHGIWSLFEDLGGGRLASHFSTAARSSPLRRLRTPSRCDAMVSPLSKGSDPYILPPGSWQGAHFAASTGLTVAANASAPGDFGSAAGASFGASCRRLGAGGRAARPKSDREGEQNDEAELRTGHFRVQIIEHGIRKSRFLVPKRPERQSLKRSVERNRPFGTGFSRFVRRNGAAFRFLNISSGFLGRNEPA